MCSACRLVYLDADMILCRNIDHLFDLPQGFWAVGDCYGGRETGEACRWRACCAMGGRGRPWACWLC